MIYELDPVVCADLQKQLPAFTVVNGCGISLLCRLPFTQYSGQQTFIYCDPPYPKSARRSSKDIYRYEWDDLDHRAFLDVILDLNCRIAISTYDSSLYATALKDWRKVQFYAQTRHGRALETLYCNYPKPTSLHDYRYLGADFTDRQRIKRKAERWVNNLQNMPDLERLAILSRITDLVK